MAKKDFLVEIGTGELPPKALRQLSDAFAANIRAALESAGLAFAQVQAFASPRRLAVRVNDLDTKQQDKAVERLGPAVAAAFDKDGNPTPAASGFARSCGVEVNALEQSDRDGVLKLAYRSVSKGSDTAALLPEMVSRALATLPIPKKMRWGFTASWGANGYVVFPSWMLSFILQWGNATTDANGACTFTFPIAFPNSAWNPLGSVGATTRVVASLVLQTPSLTSCNAWVSNSSGTAFASANVRFWVIGR